MNQVPGDDTAQPTETAGERVEPGRPDPERGFRGVIAITLCLQAIVMLLAIPVAKLEGAPGWVLGALIAYALALVGLCAFLRRPFAEPTLWLLQALAVAGFAASISLGMMASIFVVVWLVIFGYRRTYRQRLAAGTLPATPR